MENIKTLLDWIKQHTLYKQFLPTKKDLENKELKNLSQRLKSDSIDKSLINILEWQDRNINGWIERWITSVILTFFTIVSILIISLYFGKINPYLYWLLLLIPLVIWGNITLRIILNLIVFFVLILTIPLTISIFSPALNISSDFFLVFIASSFILGAFTSLLINLLSNYKSLKRYNPDFKTGDTFSLSLPIEKILKYRLAVCRDYAKLTSALILTIYPNSEIYFVLIPSHVAVGIKIDGKIYVLDQKLPVLPLNKWKEKWEIRFRKRNLNIKMVRIYFDGDKVKIKSLKCDDILSNLSKSELSELNKLINNIRISYKLKDSKPKTKPTSELNLKDIMTFFSNDDLIENSLKEAIKNRIEDELVTNINNLVYLDAEIKNKELILKLWLKLCQKHSNNKNKHHLNS